ncbi:MAG TPA: flippase activity-associated protein Agl23 [Anaerolineae bacterium]|nr:flippase activity-associated protein Agl23 [Anaerolineae bacterium]
MTENRTTWLDQPVSSVLRLDWEKTLYIALFVLAVLTRFWDLGARAISHDESLHAYYSWELYRGQGFSHTPLMHGPLRFHLNALFFALFGADDFTVRIPTAISGVMLVMAPILLRRWLGRRGALVTSFFLLISPMLLYHARYIRDEPFMALYAILMAWVSLSYLHDRRSKWLIVLAMLVALMYTTMEASFIYIAVFGLFVVFIAVFEVAREAGWGRHGVAGSLLGIGAALVLFGIGLLIGARLIGAIRFEPAVDGGPSLSSVLLSLLVIGVFGVLIAAGVYSVLRALMPAAARRSAGLDLAIILGGLSLLMLSSSPLSVLNYGALYERVGDNFRVMADAGTTTVWGLLSGEGTTVFVDPYFFAGGNFPTDPANAMNVARLAFLFVCFTALAMGIGLWWSARIWTVALGIFGGIGIVLFTTVFTNGIGLGTGFVGSLGYWLAQQAVSRGTQPTGYHFFIGIMYEYLPMLLSVVALLYYGSRYVRGRSVMVVGTTKPDLSDHVAVPLFMTLVVLLWAGFTVAGEKMPWHMTHLAMPMILLSGRLVGDWLDRIDWRGVAERRTWLALVLFPIAFLAIGAVLASLGAARAAQPGVAAPSLTQLNAWSGLLSGLLIGGGALAALVMLTRRSGMRPIVSMIGLAALVLLTLMTVHTSWSYTYINYDYPTEFGVYAHGSPGLKIALDQIRKLSERVTGTPTEIELLYDSESTWPWLWYLRDFPNKRLIASAPSRGDMTLPVMILYSDNWAAADQAAGNSYNSYEFQRIWWPMEDYKRIPDIVCPREVTRKDGSVERYAAYDENGDSQIDASEEAAGTARCLARMPTLLSALWDIFFRRDYTQYADLTGQNMTLQDWPLRAEFRLYVRRDLAAKVWDQAIGDLAASSSVAPNPVASDPYPSRWQELAASQVIGSAGSDEGQFVSPHGVAIAPNGSIYVADSNNHRVVKFDGDGRFVKAFGTWSGEPPNGDFFNPDWNPPPGTFYEPWDVAAAPDGSVYVADLWNSRIQKFDEDGNFVTMWGGFGDSGQAARGTEGRFYGPRGVAVGEDGLVYVSDTGNKRVQVFDGDGKFVAQFGGGGLLDGNLDEPVGIAVTGDGEIVVADTWNGRVQVFSADGQPLRKWDIAGWLDYTQADFGRSKVGKPYLTVGPDGRIYVSDQVGNRILVFDASGNYLASFGRFGADDVGFTAPSGLAIDADGNILVVDTGNGRVMVFPPLDTGEEDDELIP